jgi:hypothetical protein
MEAKWTSRKFLLTVAFFALVLANGIYKLGISEGMLYALAATLGIYDLANSYQSASNEPTIKESFVQTVYEDLAKDIDV